MSIHEANSKQKLTKEVGNDEVIAERRGSRQGQLRRMPHVFCKLLDLPFPVETNVVIEERREAYAFMIRQPGLQKADIVAETVEIVPGAIKVILRGADRIRAALTKDSSLPATTENWRARLPTCTIPESAKASYAHGIITITIPKLLPAREHAHRSPCNSGCAS